MTTSTAAGNAARSPTQQGGPLRLALRLDAVVTGLNGAAYLLAAPALDDLLGLPAGLLQWMGAFLLVYAAGVWLVAARRVMDAGPVRVVIGLNAVWAVGSVVVALTGAGTPSTVGAAWIVVQAIVVASFAVLQAAGLRRHN